MWRLSGRRQRTVITLQDFVSKTSTMYVHPRAESLHIVITKNAGRHWIRLTMQQSDSAQHEHGARPTRAGRMDGCIVSNMRVFAGSRVQNLLKNEELEGNLKQTRTTREAKRDCERLVLLPFEGASGASRRITLPLTSTRALRSFSARETLASSLTFMSSPHGSSSMLS